VGTTPISAFAFDPINNNAFTFETNVQGIVIAGSGLGQMANTKIYGSVSITGNVTTILNTSTIATYNQSALAGFSVVYTVLETVEVNVIITGIAGQTVDWTGYTLITGTI